MNLLINALLENWKIILFNDSRKIIAKKDIKTLNNESEKLIWYIDDFLDSNKIKYWKLENIVVFAGPWSFTGVRTISLLVNTINFIIKKNITSLKFFDLYDNYPIVKASSKRDSFFKKTPSSEIEIIKNNQLIIYLEKNNISKIYWENKNLIQSISLEEKETTRNIKIFEKIDYSDIIKKIEFKKEKIIKPIYIKKPNIS